jgi:nucleosome binding factor SPN SPT16 subunit
VCDTQCPAVLITVCLGWLVTTCVTTSLQGGWAFLDLEKSDGEDEDEEQSSEGFNPGSDAEEEEESSEDISDEVRLALSCLSAAIWCCCRCVCG